MEAISHMVRIVQERPKLLMASESRDGPSSTRDLCKSATPISYNALTLQVALQIRFYKPFRPSQKSCIEHIVVFGSLDLT